MDEEAPPKRQSTFPLFSRYFATHPQNVVDYLNNMRKQMEDFIDAFKKRIEVEVNYSKSLTSVSKALDKYIKPGTDLASSFISSAFKVEHEQRSRQALQLAQSLRSQVEVMCSQFLRKETVQIKKLEKDVKRYYKEAGNVDQNHRDCLARFQSISKEMEEMIITKNIMKYTTGIPQEKKVKLISKTMDSIRENKEYEKLYLQSVKSFNSFTSAYNTEIQQQLDTAQTQIRDQVTLQCDCMRKLIVAEVSMFKNIEYDLLNISKQMEYLDTQKEVESFVEEAKDSSNNRIIFEEKVEEEVKRKSITSEMGPRVIESKKVVGKSMLSNSLLHVDQEYFSWMLFNKKNKQIRDIVSGIWKKLRGKESSEDYKIEKIEIQEETENKEEVKAEIQQEKQKQESNGAEQTEVKSIQTEQMKKQGQNVEKKVKILDWSLQLKQFLSSLKIQHPPNMLNPSEKNSIAMPSQQVYQAFMEIMQTISLLWNNENLDASEIDKNIEALEKQMKQHHLYRLIAFIFLEEYRVQLQVQIKNSDCAGVCSRVLRVILRESQKENDTFIIRGLLGLIFTYYWVDDKYKKLLYLHPEVYQCDIWKKHDFWEAAIFETTYEEMSVFNRQKGETPAETILRQKNIIFSQLASFCHYMVMLGVTSKNVRLIVGRYCRLYDMTEEQNKDLSKMISNTVKQFKEISFQFSLKDKPTQE